MQTIKLCILLICILFNISCSDNSDELATLNKLQQKNNTTSNNSVTHSNEIKSESATNKNNLEKSQQDLKDLKNKLLHQKIAYGKATLAEVRQALSTSNSAYLTNIIHALYSLRGHRGVYNLLFDMWDLNKEKYPELAWDKISRPPARIALASTLNRILVVNSDVYKDYIYSFKNDDNEFHLAQVVISLGFNGSPDDVEYIKSMADGSNHYVAQSAITALALMGGNFARDAMIDLSNKHEGTTRGDLIKNLLKQVYKWPPGSTDIFKMEEIMKKDSDSKPTLNQLD